MILVVDDNPIQALTRKAILAGAGMEAHIADSAEAAFAALENDTNQAITLVITDHIMPGECGCHFVQDLWSRRAGLPVIVLSGSVDAEQDYAGLDVTFRAKPIRPVELIALASRMSNPQLSKL